MHKRFIKRAAHRRSGWDFIPVHAEEDGHVRDVIQGPPSPNNAADPLAGGPVTLTFTVTHGPENTPAVTLPDQDDDDTPTVGLPIGTPPAQTTTDVNTVPVQSPQTPDASASPTITTAMISPATASSSILPPASTSSTSSSSNPGGASSADNASTSTVKLSSGAVAGIVIGCLIVLIAATVFGLRKRSTKNRLKLRGIWTGSKALKMGKGGSGDGVEGFEPTPYTYQPPEGTSAPVGQRDLNSAGERRMSYVGGQPATAAAFAGANAVQNPVSARPMSAVSSDMLQTLPSAYGYGYGYGLSGADSMPSPSIPGGTGSSVLVARTFIPSLPDELPISSGETLRVVEVFDDGWAECMNRNGEVGMVPLECFDRPPSASARPSPTMVSSPVGGGNEMTRAEGTRNSRRYTSLPGARR